MTRDEVDNVVRQALDELITEHAHLIEVDANERSISHFLALCLQRKISTWGSGLSVDVEYNRDGHVPKRLALPSRATSDQDTAATTVFPDIIVHERGCNSRNVLVIEMKKTDSDCSYDHTKLRAFISQLGYQFAVQVVVSLKNGRPGCELSFID